MAWTSIDDAASYHPKARKAGLEAWGFFVAAIVYSNKHLKDGFIARECLDDVWPWGGKLERIAQRLAQVELFDVVDGGWRIHNYLKYQRSRDEILAQRAADAERKKLAREQMPGKRPAGRRPDGDRTDAGQTPDGARHPDGIQTASEQRPALAYAGTRASAHASAGAFLSPPILSLPDPSLQQPNQSASVAGSSFHNRETLASVTREVGEALATPSRLTCTSDLRPVPATTTPPTMVDESLRFPDPNAENFNERDLERAVSEVRGTEWRIPTALHHRRQARETAALIMEFAHQGGYDPHAIARAAFDAWRKASKSIDPMVWCADWAGQLPPPPKTQEKWRDLEG